MKNKYYKFSIILVVILVFLLLLFRFYPPLHSKLSQENDLNRSDQALSETPPEENEAETNITTSEPENENTENNQSENIPAEPSLAKSALIKVPFLSQAPFGNWDSLHEDACEEASLIMVESFRAGSTEISAENGDKKIQELVAYESAHGYGLSISLAELNTIAEATYNTAGRINRDVTVTSIKQEILAGKPVIIPAAGKLLPNPNFRNGGPNYHMLVIKGYDQSGFITNDPGTRKGNNFYYKYNDLINAIHDWDPNNILNGEKAYLVFN